MSDNLIHLAFRSPMVEEDQRSLLACATCKNKTFRVVVDQPGTFPLMECAACNQHIGRMGWAHDDDPALAV